MEKEQHAEQSHGGKTNFDLLCQHLREDSLARKLVRAYWESSAHEVKSAIQGIVEARLIEVRAELDHDKNKLA